MINITPTSHYSTNFKAKTDYSKIYKEMEKISVRRDEKIIPKQTQKIKSIMHNTMNKKVNDILDSIFKLTSIAGILAVPLTILLKSYIVNNDTNINSKNKPHHSEQKLTTTADSLNTLLDKKTISFDEYRKQMKNLVKNTN